MRRFAIIVLVAACCAYALYAGLFWRQQRYLLFPIASPERHALRAPLPEYGRLVELPASFGTARAVFLRGPQGVAPAVVYTHGNGEIVDQHVRGFDAIRALGFHVLLVEYPGYGGADGETSLENIAQASVAAYDWLVRQPDVDRERVVAMGKSLGGAAAAELTRHRPVRALVLQSTFTAVADFASQLYLPAWLVRDPFDSVARLRAFAGPVLVTHGRRDELIPFAHGERLAAAARTATSRWYDCGHNDCPYEGADYLALLGDFLQKAAK